MTMWSRLLEVCEKTICMAHELTNDKTGDLVAITVIVELYIDAHFRRTSPMPSNIAPARTIHDREPGDLSFATGISTGAQVHLIGPEG